MLRLIDIMGPTCFYSPRLIFGLPMQRAEWRFTVGDNDDIPKITAIDYDRWSWCRVSSSLL